MKDYADYLGIPPDDLSPGERKLWYARLLRSRGMNSKRMRQEAKALLRHEGNYEMIRDMDNEEELT